MGFFDFLGGVERQVNVFDSGKTYKNKKGNVNDKRSSATQAKDLGFNFLKTTVQPFKEFGHAVIETPHAIIREVQNKPIDDIQRNVFGTNDSGTIAKKIFGDTAQVALTAASGGISSGVKAALPNASKFVTAPVTGAALGAPFNVAAGFSNGGPMTPESILRDAVIGGTFGAGLGLGGQAVGSGGRAAFNRIKETPLNEAGFIGRGLSSDDLKKLSAAEDVNAVKSILKGQVEEDRLNKIAPAIVVAKDRNAIQNLVDGKSVPFPARPIEAKSPLPPTTPVISDIAPAGQGTVKLPTANTPKIAKTTDVSLNAKKLNLTPEQQDIVTKTTTETIPTMTNKQIESYARSVGIDTKNYTPEQTKLAISKQLNARKQAVMLENDIAKMRESGASVDDIARAIEQAADIEKAARSQGTHVARQLQARKILADELSTPQQRIFKLLDVAGVDPKDIGREFAKVDFNDGNQVISAYRKLVPPSAGEWVDLVRYNSMLSSPLTQLVNIASTTSNIGISPIERGLTSSLDKLRPLLGKERQYASGEGRAYTKGLVKSFPDAVKEFKDTFMGKNVNPNVEFGTKALIPVRAVGDNKAVDILSFPQRLLGAFDSLNQTLVRGGATEALKTRAKAGIEVVNPEVLATKEGAYRAFNQQLNTKQQGYVLRAVDELTTSVMRLRDSSNPVIRWPAKLTLPFVRIGSNLFKQGLEYSPAGVLTIPGSSEITPQLSKMIIGTSVFGLAGALVGDDRLTWGEPRNAKEKEAFKAAGKQAYSVKIGGKWYGFSKLPPFISFNFALAAGIDDAIKSSKLDSDGADNIMSAVAKLGQFYSDQTYLKNVGDALGAVRGDAEKVSQLVSNYPQQFVPFRALSSWFAKMTDDTQRKINTDAGFAERQVESLMQQIPGLRGKTTERTGPDGEPLKSQNPFLNSVSPVQVSNQDSSKMYLTDFYEARKKAPARTPVEKKIKEALKNNDEDLAIKLAIDYNRKYASAFDKWSKKYSQYANDEELYKSYSRGKITEESLSRWYNDLVNPQ